LTGIAASASSIARVSKSCCGNKPINS
jgi:hypothetical protein